MKKFMKALALVACAAILVAGSVAATFAYLTTKTETIGNTFTAGDIRISLAETTQASYKMVPGTSIDKDPTVTVEAGSEKCYLFVKIDKSQNFDTYMTYTIAADWAPVDGADGVYYQIVDASQAKKVLPVLLNNEVQANADCTKEQYNSLGGDLPTLSVTAYAVQFEGIATVALAWTHAQTAAVPTP